MSAYSVGIYLGSGLAFVVGGQIVAFAGGAGASEWPVLGAVKAWQAPLVVAGLAGLVLAPLAWTLPEPQRTGCAWGTPPLGELARWIARHPRAFVAHHGGFALLSMSGYAVNVWTVFLLERHFALEKARASTSYGLVLGLGGALGVLLGGFLADRRRARGALDANVSVGALAGVVAAPFALAFPLVRSSELALALLAPLSIATAAGFGVAAAGAVELVPSTLRGRASAVYLFVINAAGLGLGVPLVGWLAEHALGGESSFPLALALVGGLSALGGGALLLWGRRASRVRRLARVSASTPRAHRRDFGPRRGFEPRFVARGAANRHASRPPSSSRANAISAASVFDAFFGDSSGFRQKRSHASPATPH